MILRVYSIGIDVLTRHSCMLVNRLKALKSTVSVTHGGVYWQDVNYAQVHLETTMTEDELDLWLYKTKGVEAIGLFNREDA